MCETERDVDVSVIVDFYVAKPTSRQSILICVKILYKQINQPITNNKNYNKYCTFYIDTH